MCTHTHLSLCDFSVLLITITICTHANNLHIETIKYRVWQNYLTVFEIWKPACFVHATPILTIIMYSDVWSLVEMGCWWVDHHTAAVELSKQSLLQLHSMVSDSWFKDMIPLAAILCGWIWKWCQEGSVMDSKPQGHPLLAHTPDNLEQVIDAMLRSPCRSAGP